MNKFQQIAFRTQFASITSHAFKSRYNYKRQELKNNLRQTIQNCRDNNSFQQGNFFKLENLLQKNELNLRFYALVELYIKIHETIQNNEVVAKWEQCFQESEIATDLLLDMRQIQKTIINYMESTYINNFFTII